jgi:hypothetical protein
MEKQKESVEKFEPIKYRHVIIQPVDNKPKHKKGDNIIYWDYKQEKYIESKLVKVAKNKITTPYNIRGCISCQKRGSIIKTNAWAYVWNGEINESSILQDITEKLNNLRRSLNESERKLSEDNEKASKYDKIYNAIKGIDEDDW